MPLEVVVSFVSFEGGSAVESRGWGGGGREGRRDCRWTSYRDLKEPAGWRFSSLRKTLLLGFSGLMRWAVGVMNVPARRFR